ncbi:tyrosine-type recombinase/integrase, partial [Jiella marina]|uniref:tyrosine-type recombinase/integrase n=1 Tax=Jiella sp. LLJ827 TaxID=2917712 RepID=UPI00210101DC
TDQSTSQKTWCMSSVRARNGANRFRHCCIDGGQQTMPLSIYKRGEVWHYRGTVQGELLRGTCGTTEQAKARRVAQNVEQQAWAIALAGPRCATFAEAAMLYLDARKSARFLMAVATYFKETPCDRITPEAARSGAIATYPFAGPATRNRQFITVTQAVINHAAALGKAPQIRIKKFRVPKVEKDYGTYEWLRLFIQSADSELAACYALMFFTGARIGEVMNVKLRDVQWKEQRIRIVMSKVGGDERFPHMPKALAKLLQRLDKTDPDAPMFMFANRSAAQKRAARICKAAGIKYLSPHAMRHGFATGLLHRGIDPVSIARLGGWSSPLHVLGTYGHSRDDETIPEILCSGNL